MQKKLIIEIVVALVALVGLTVAAISIGVFSGLGWLSDKDESPDQKKQERKIDEKGDLIIYDRPLVFDEKSLNDEGYIPISKVSSIYVYNETDENAVIGDGTPEQILEYRFNMDPVAQDFIMEGSEMLSFDAEKIAYLKSATTFMLAMERVENASQDLTQYGLPDGMSDKYYVITEVDGTEHKLYVGDAIPSGAAVYCKYENKPYVYIVDKMLEQYVFVDPSHFIVPLITTPYSTEKISYVTDIKLYKDGKLFVSLDRIPDDEIRDQELMVTHRMTYPADYVPSQTVMDVLLRKLAYFEGSRVVKYNIPAEEIDAVVEEYGFDNASRVLTYKLDDKEHMIIFGDKTEDGLEYFVLNTSQYTICTVPAADIPFADYELIEIIDNCIFSMDINNVESIEVRTAQHKETFVLEQDEEKGLLVKRGSNGSYVDTYSFRQFYIDILLVTLDGNAENIPEQLNEVLAYTINDKKGNKHEYCFYDLETRKVYFTVNGKGEFYAGRDMVNKVIDNIDKLIKGEAVISEALK